MPEINATADKVIGKALYAKQQINALTLPDPSKVAYVIKPKELVTDSVYSWVTGANGGLYWQFQKNGKYYYVKHGEGLFDLPSLPMILAEIKAELEKKEKEEKGVVSYYIEKYAPWIVGGIVAAVALPAITTTFNKRNTAMGNTEDKNKRTVLLVGGAIAVAYFAFMKKPKRKGSIAPIDAPYGGEFVPDEIPPGEDILRSMDVTDVSSVQNEPGRLLQKIDTADGRIVKVGVYPVLYDHAQTQSLAGTARKNLGTIHVS